MRKGSMGTVVKFPESARIARDGRTTGGQPWSATVIILPVIRVERYYEAPSNPLSAGSGTRPGRKRRRRASRS
jgi:hypothetical protein